MRKITAVLAAAASFVLSGCATVGPYGYDRGQGTTRVFHASVAQVLAAAQSLQQFKSFGHLQVGQTVYNENGCLYAVPNDPIDRQFRRVSLMTSPTDANGDTRVEIAMGLTKAPAKTTAQNFILDQIAKALESGGGNSAEAEAAPDQSPSAVERKMKARYGQPAPANEAPRRADALSSDVDQPRRKLPQDAKAFAIVIGVEKYSNELPDAKFAEHDAQAVRASLVALGFPERNIKFLTGARATKSNLEAYIEEWLPRNVKEGGKVFVYFSGHGAPDPESNQAYLVPVDGDPNYLGKTAYPVKKLYASLGKLKAKQIIVALDSCFSGAGGRSVLADGARPLITKVDTAVGHDSKITLFAAASPREITSTLNEQGHGMFTYYFLKGLEGAAADENGAVTAQSLYDYLKPQVQDAASRQNRDQTPMLEGDSNRELARFK